MILERTLLHSECCCVARKGALVVLPRGGWKMVRIGEEAWNFIK